ncbi:MAG: response regulator transcription factor [Acutalibacteraceae bacterium]
MSKILIVEDDSDIAEVERDYLELSGYSVDITPNGIDAIESEKKNHYSLILLDLMLPGLDGFSVCKKLREMTDIPILMVTARKEDVDKIRGLGLGADDYIEKPFSPSVLVARVKANLSQYERLKKTGTQKQTVFTVGDFTVNASTRRVYVKGKEIPLKNMEYELLYFLMTNADIVFDRETLYERIWGMDAMGDNATVAVHINRLREKIEEDPANPKYIETVWGSGYRFKE